MDVDTSGFPSGTHTIIVTPVSARLGDQISALMSSNDFTVGGEEPSKSQ